MSQGMSSLQPSAHAPRRRDKAQLSCTSCRSKKCFATFPMQHLKTTDRNLVGFDAIGLAHVKVA